MAPEGCGPPFSGRTRHARSRALFGESTKKKYEYIAHVIDTVLLCSGGGLSADLRDACPKRKVVSPAQKIALA